jgi:exopolysaccharide biosynthesis polyprenyl glycosylphosphotransferase
VNPEMVIPKQVQKSSPWQLRIGERRVVLLIGDLFIALISWGLALYFWASGEKFLGISTEFLQKRVNPQPWFYLMPFIWLVLLVELYDVHRAGDWGKTIRGIALAASIGLVLYLLLYFYYVDPPRSLLPRRGVAGFLIAASLLTLIWRRVYIQVFTAPQFLRRALLVGGGKTGEILLRVLNDIHPAPFFLVGIVDDDPQKLGAKIEGSTVIGGSDCLLEILAKNSVTDVIVAISGELHGSMFQALLDAQERGLEIIRMPVVYEELLNRVPIRVLEADWILRSFVDESRVSGFYELGKRLLDIVGGMIGTLVFLVILPFAALAILIDDRLPIFYDQTRSGRGGQPYKIVKFRTMRRDAEPDGKPQWAKEDDERATRIGKFLRKTHLDELPQFLNVVRGDMSLVGPRAERPELVELFQKHVPFYRARLLVKPGITGWAQVNFGYASSIDETITKLEYDLYYIKHRSLIMDLLILLRTPATMLGFRGR